MPVDIIKLIPPLVSTFGIIPFILKNSPLQYPQNIKHFAIAIFILIIWVGFFLASLVGPFLFYPMILTISFLLIGLLFFGLLFISLSKKGAEDRPKYLTRNTFYALGLLFSTMAFTNYSGLNNKVVVYIDTKQSILWAEAQYKDDTVIRVYFEHRIFYRAKLFEKGDFNKVKCFNFFLAPDKSLERIQVDRINIEKMGLGEVYDISF